MTVIFNYDLPRAIYVPYRYYVPTTRLQQSKPAAITNGVLQVRILYTGE